MSVEAETAGELVSVALKGIEGVITLSGKGAVSLAAFLVAALRDQKRTKGKVNLNAFRDKNTSVFTISAEELKLFHRAAKKYGILYSAIVDKKHPDGQSDIIIAKEDAGRVNRIIERFRLNALKIPIEEKEGEEEKETDKTKATEKVRRKTEEAPIPTMRAPKDEEADAELLKAFFADGPNPTNAKKEQENPSAPSLRSSDNSAESLTENSRPSVRNALADAAAEARRLNERKREHLPPLSQTGPSLPDLGSKSRSVPKVR